MDDIDAKLAFMEKRAIRCEECGFTNFTVHLPATIAYPAKCNIDGSVTLGYHDGDWVFEDRKNFKDVKAECAACNHKQLVTLDRLDWYGSFDFDELLPSHAETYFPTKAESSEVIG